MAHPVKLATPAARVTVRPPVLVQESTPALGLLLMARVTVVALSPVSVLPLVSCSATDTLKVPVPVAWILAPDAGWVVKVSLVAGPGLFVSEKVAVVVPVAAAVTP